MDMLRCKFTVLVAQIFPEFTVKLSGIDQLYFSFAVGGGAGLFRGGVPGGVP